MADVYTLVVYSIGYLYIVVTSASVLACVSGSSCVGDRSLESCLLTIENATPHSPFSPT